MQWLATPLNALDSAIDRLTTPRRVDAHDDADDMNTGNGPAGAQRQLVLDDDARAAAEEDDGFTSHSDAALDGGGSRTGFGTRLDIGPLAGSAAIAGDDQSVTQQTIDINDAAMGTISPLKHDDAAGGEEEEAEEEGAFVNGGSDLGSRAPPPMPMPMPLPLHPTTKSRAIGGAPVPVDAAAESTVDRSRYVLETPPTRPWPPQPQPMDVGTNGPPVSNDVQPPALPATQGNGLAGPTHGAATAAGAVAGISPFPGRLVKRARPPSPTEEELRSRAEGYLSRFVVDGGDDGSGAGGATDTTDGEAEREAAVQAEMERQVREEAAQRIAAQQQRAEAERAEAERMERERQRAEREAGEQARREREEAQRVAAAEAAAAAEREAAVKAEMERQVREEAARRIAAQQRAEAERRAREEEEVRRMAAAAAEEEARRREEAEEARRALEAEAKRQEQEEAERRRAIAEEQALIAAKQARAAAEAKAEAEKRLREAAMKAGMERQVREEAAKRVAAQRKAEAERKARDEEARRIAEEDARRREEAERVEEYQNETSRDDDLDSEYEDYEVHLPLQPWDAPLLKRKKDGLEDDTVTEISSFSSPLPSWEPTMNRRGVVQIRLHRAQRLPCAAGRSVRANITLPPWKGKVTTEWTKAYIGPEGVPPDTEEEDHSFEDVGAGVCARWDEGDIDEPNKEEIDDEFDEISSGVRNAPVTTYNLVHHYNDIDTPVPDISIELTSTSMLGFESTMLASVPLSVGVLMREPGIWRRRWCPVSAPGKDGAPQPSSPRRNVSGAVRGNGESPQTFARRKRTAEAFDAYGTAEALGPLFLVEGRFVPSSLNNGDVGDKNDDESDFASAHGNLEERGTPSTQDASTSLQPVSGSVPSENQPSFGVPHEAPHTITSVAAPVAIPPRPTLDAFMQAEQYKEADSDVQSVTSALTASTATKSQRRILQAKPHHLRVLPSWSSPAWCSICSAFVVPFRATCYECETCSIICCTDCQLRVDVRLPCGSDEAKEAAERARRSTVSGALGELMSVVAPIEEKADDGVDGKIPGPSVTGKANQTSRAGLSQNSIDGVASLRIKLVRACLFDRPYAPETDLDYILKKEGRALRVGDHYARITWTGSGVESKRTRTVFQTARPHFDSEILVFDIPHYGTEYRIEVIDANTDQVVGTALFPAQSLLQWQRDEMSTSSNLPLRSVLDIRAQREMHKKKVIELRKGVKSGFGLDYFNTAKKKDDASKTDSTEEERAGEISGWMECDVELLENTKGLISGTEVQEIAPNTTPDEFRIDLVQLHIARIRALIAGIKKLAGAYLYIVSWEDPILTTSSLVIFIWLCLRFNMEYIGSLPPSMLALYMTYLWKKRRAGQFASRWIKTEREARVEAEKKLTINHSTHRPIGFLDVSVVRGKNLRSYELGLPGAAYASVFWDALHFVPEAEREQMAEIDPTAKGTHEIGSTVAAGISSNPEWTTVVESSESERLKQLIPADEGEIDEAADAEGITSSMSPLALQFPILQPISQDPNVDSNDSRGRENAIHIVPWESSPGAIVVQICFQDALNKFALIDPYFGDVTIPLKLLAKKKEIEGWFPVNDISGAVNGLEKSFSSGTLVGRESKTPVKDKKHSDGPQIYLKLKLTLPGSFLSPLEEPSDAEKEASVIIAEEMMRLSAMAEGENFGLIGTGLNTFNTVRGLNSQLQGIQNTLGGVLDTIERVRNVFNFASPNRSSIIVVCLLALWLVLAIIPTRAIVLLGGLGQYGASFYAAYGKKFRSKKEASRPPISQASSAETKSDSTSTRIANFIAGLPTDEDLRRAYFWEARREGEKAREELALKKRMLRLNRLWRARWFGTVELKEFTFSKEADRQWDWEPVFSLVHGHRFIWWRSEKHFDDGEPPLGQIFFAGHSGLGGLSPMEMRELSREEALLIVTMFGRGVEEQQKISLLCPNAKAKEALEDAIIGASTGSKVD